MAWWHNLLDTALSGAFGFGTSAYNNSMARQNARESMAWQERMMDKQNEYNSPLNQMLLKRAAGVNPYGETGFTPSAGVSSVQADTLPMDNPLAYAKVFAEIDNINSVTNKTETETEKLLKEMSMLDLAYERGLLEKSEYEKRLQMMFEAWEKNNPYEVEMENIKSQTALNLSNISLNDAEISLKDALSEYQSIINSNADEEQKSRIALNLANALSNRANAEATKVLRDKYHAEIDLLDEQAWHTAQSEVREAALHEYEKQLRYFAVQMSMTESELSQLERDWQNYINPRDSDGDFSVAALFARFIYGNLNISLSGNAGYSKSTK